MPPKLRFESGGGGNPFEHEIIEEDIAEVAERSGMSIVEAREYLDKASALFVELITSKRPELFLERIASIVNEYELRFGQSEPFDDFRIQIANMLFKQDAILHGSVLMAGVQNFDLVIEEINTDPDGIRVKIGDLGAALADGILIHEIRRSGRELEYDRKLRNYLIRRSPPSHLELIRLVDINIAQITDGAIDPVSDWADLEREYLPGASWDQIAILLKNDELWPHNATITQKRQIGYFVAAWQHAIFSKPKIERRDVEALKQFLKEVAVDFDSGSFETDLPDWLRFVTAHRLYRQNEPRLGLSMARSMDHPGVMALLCDVLISEGRDGAALELVNEIPFYAVRAKVLYEGDWRDKESVQDLIKDITVATSQTTMRYDPVLRIGIAAGLEELFAAKIRASQESADEGAAARWGAELEEMTRRRTLLEHQRRTRYIKEPKAKGGKK